MSQERNSASHFQWFFISPSLLFMLSANFMILSLFFLRMLEICCSTCNNDNDNNNDYNNEKLWNFVLGNVGWWFLCQCPYQSSSHNPGKEKLLCKKFLIIFFREQFTLYSWCNKKYYNIIMIWFCHFFASH